MDFLMVPQIQLFAVGLITAREFALEHLPVGVNLLMSQKVVDVVEGLSAVRGPIAFELLDSNRIKEQGFVSSLGVDVWLG